MSIIEAVFLGIIQGLTEFLPISSTGHLTVAGKLMGLISVEHPERWTSFIAVIQLGTLLAILIYFWKDLFHITIDFIKDNLISRKGFKSQTDNSKMGWYIILGSIPVVIIGLGFKDIIEGALTKNLYVISLSLIILGIILAFAEKVGKFKKELKDITWKDALLIGVGQSLALIPGSSRSGTTITAGLFLGLKRETAARFSFLLSVPAILGSGLLQFYESLQYIDFDSMVTLIIATIAAALSGYLTIEFLLRFLKKNSTFVFVYYRIIIGLSVLTLIYMNYINP
ncbi:MAG: undecaprenyl-diphosphatase UppP [Melioribacteraceae bacterium]|nr:undecaprenyl-diphosphatase UppP [Melioribacteraceae bacterium]MCF8355835.1 undecaprenyl-diphosphatase UppP [Melioribacteraceae bacterium]MCF8392590.1 undecaprenyl-diphosphatase UppP [Melioribacteraceae bacterium]MCF8418538.1 undecaprenyl-diphosphatase UppP [Melioribacteraceae bacterium]